VRHSFGLVFIGCALLFPLISPMSVLAQTIQPGKYTGRVQFVFMGKPVSHMATLTVEKVADERIWGVAWLGRGGNFAASTRRCRGGLKAGC